MVCGLRGENLDLVTICQAMTHGHKAVIDLPPMQWLPTMEWMAKAKSRTVAPCGKVRISPFGVKTLSSDAKRLSLMVSRRSSVSGWGSSRISLIELTQVSSSRSYHFRLWRLIFPVRGKTTFSNIRPCGQNGFALQSIYLDAT